MCVLGMYNKSVAQTSASPVKNIVLVHGAWVDGSGWKPVYDILVKDGYTVTLVQEPLTSFAEDVRATKRVLDQQQGPCILVVTATVVPSLLRPERILMLSVWSTSRPTCPIQARARLPMVNAIQAPSARRM